MLNLRSEDKVRGTKRKVSGAVRTLRQELLGFRFDYPVEAVPEACHPGSLHYHIYSDRLFLDDLEFDANGVAMKNYRAQGRQYNPLFVAWWGLVNLERYLRRDDEESLRNSSTKWNGSGRTLWNEKMARSSGLSISTGRKATAAYSLLGYPRCTRV